MKAMRHVGGLVLLSFMIFVALPVSAKIQLGGVEESSPKKTAKDKSNMGTSFGTSYKKSFGVSHLSINPSNNSQYGPADGFTAEFAMVAASRYGAALSYGRYDQDVKADVLRKGRMETQFFDLSITYAPLKPAVFNPYVLIGGGYYSLEYKPDLIQTEWWDKFEGNFGYHYGAGVKVFPVGEKISFNAEYRQVAVEGQIHYTGFYSCVGYVKETIGSKAGGAMIRLGMSYHF